MDFNEHITTVSVNMNIDSVNCSKEAVTDRRILCF